MVNVSIIIPARNATETLSETLDSVLAQTHGAWEAIVVDDGSDDGTADLAATFAARDPRIRVTRQPWSGVSAARNRGIAEATGDWLLFLDADDWIRRDHLETMVRRLDAEPRPDGVICGWARVAVDGSAEPEPPEVPPDALFPVLARRSAFPIHACLVRRSLVEAVGRFDPDLKTCEDWDLWQRVTRAGARFAILDEVLALYRTRTGSASGSARQMLTDGLIVMARGHSPDPRVSRPLPAYAHGLPADGLQRQQYAFLCWCAGLLLGSGQDARGLLAALSDVVLPDLAPESVADCIFTGSALADGRSTAMAHEVWPKVDRRLDDFLTALEGQAGSPALARPARAALERLSLTRSDAEWPATFGGTYGIRIEITEPIPDIETPAGVERLYASLRLEGEPLGVVQLPVCDGLVPAPVLADAIAAEFAWGIIGRFFERTVYREITVEEGPEGLVLRRRGACLGAASPDDVKEPWSRVHERVFWPVFLQELWGKPDWPRDRFYDPEAPDEATRRESASRGTIALEASQELPDIEVRAPELEVVLTLGGVALGVVAIAAPGPVVRAQRLRAAFTAEGGFELCRAAVREGLLGRPLDEVCLRRRLAEAATSAARSPGWWSAPDRTTGLDGAAEATAPVLVLGRRFSGVNGTSVSRRAALPAAAASDLLEAAAATGETVVGGPPPGQQPRRAFYAPDCISVSARREAPGSATAATETPPHVATADHDGRRRFETLFASEEDPWGYTTPYEQTKYERSLSLLPPGPILRALELGCAEGHFTAQLAPRVEALVAADVSLIALERAAARCSRMNNVRFVHLDLARDPLPGRFELIVASELLYYVGDVESLRTVARRIADALEPGGHLLAAHANVVADEPDRTGFDWDVPFGAQRIGATLAGTPGLRLVSELRTPLYRIQLFRREPAPGAAPVAVPDVRVIAEPEPLPHPAAAARIRWGGGAVRRGVGEPRCSDHVPILMYHRIAPTGPASLARYRVTPTAFEEQLRYLRDAGYYSIGLEGWRAAKEAYSPLPGRPIILTFDDGYLDFERFAWPLLRRYGLSPIVFLVADLVGRASAWDRGFGDEVPLLGWTAVRRLQEAGVEFGSHSARHRAMTSLSSTDIVRDAARSRAVLEQRLGRPVRAFAYPYGQVDDVVKHLIGAVGFIYGLTARPSVSRYQDPLLALPRIEVTGSDSLADFVRKVERG